MGLDDSLWLGHGRLMEGRRVNRPIAAGALKERIAPFAIYATICALIVVTSAIGVVPASAQQTQTPPQTSSTSQTPLVDPDTSAVKEKTLLQEKPRIEGRIVIPAQREAVLIQPAGRAWRFFHEVLLHWIGAVVIIGALVLLALGYFALGRIRISDGRSGRKVQRFNAFERFSHWLTAASFVVLALTGLNITFGKLLLLPLLGPDTFSAVSEAAKYVHNFTSFPFAVGLVLIVALWIKDNIPRKIDVIWIKEGGGFIGAKHPPAGRFNAGEKLVFWFALCGGAGIIVSGFLLLFPFYVTNIAGMQITQIVHSLIAVFFIAVILGHIYVGTLGMEGAFEAMGTGEVDLNWAKEHHRNWLEEELAKGREPTPPPGTSASPAE
jgi:formate dehydrogenase subunit gamma